MNGKQRAALRSMASTLDPIFQIGKGNITENQIQGIDDALEKRELIKISVLRSSEIEADEALAFLAETLKAIPVCAIGNKIVLYRRSKSDKVKHIEL